MTKSLTIRNGRRSRLAPLVTAAALVGLALAAPALCQSPPRAEPDVADPDAPIIEAVEIQQNRYVPKDSLMYYVSIRPGERYDERRVRADFRRLWETGFLDDLLLDVRDGRKGKIVTFVVRERRRVMIVDYRGSKAVTRSAIEDKLKEKELALKLDTFFDARKVQRIEEVIREMLVEAGRPFGTVRHEAKPVGGAGLQVSFILDDGAKARVQEIAFVGNQRFSDGKLRKAMKKIRQKGFWNLSWLLGGTTFTEEKWREDQGKLEDYYRNRGHVTATVGEAQTFYEDCPGATPKRPCKHVRLEIPVSEGEAYRVGKIEIEGGTIFKEAAVRSLVKLKEGDLYRWSRVKKGYDKLRDWYGAAGYFNFTPQTKTQPDPEKRVVDVKLVMQEDKRYYVGKIRFVGNETTRDKVVRREIYLDEGGVFNTEALKLSIKRINQLGYFKQIEEMPDLAASSLGEDRVDVTFKVKEENRNQFTLGGGVSGYEGTFVNSSFSTSNFLGAGETLQLSAQSGKRIKNYQFAVTEPYFLDRPITAGFDIYHRRVTYYGAADLTAGYVDQRTGGTLTAGIPLGRFTRLYTSYTYEVINIKEAKLEDFTPLDLYSGSVPSSLYLFDEIGKRHESRIAPSIVRNTVDNPYQPRSGSRVSLTFQVAGGPLRGTMNYISPNLEYILYLPHTKRTALGLRLEGSWVQPFGRTARLRPADDNVPYPHDSLPFYHRFALGGENQVRGYPFYSIYPALRDGRGIRGDAFGLFNAEYYVDVYGPLRILAFFDAGLVYRDGYRLDPKHIRMSTGLEGRFTMPVMNVPFRVIYAVNPNRSAVHIKDWGIKRYEFKFSVGTTF